MHGDATRQSFLFRHRLLHSDQVPSGKQQAASSEQPSLIPRNKASLGRQRAIRYALVVSFSGEGGDGSPCRRIPANHPARDAFSPKRYGRAPVNTHVEEGGCPTTPRAPSGCG
jgi:hypothetical protein